MSKGKYCLWGQPFTGILSANDPGSIKYCIWGQAADWIGLAQTFVPVIWYF